LLHAVVLILTSGLLLILTNRPLSFALRAASSRPLQPVGAKLVRHGRYVAFQMAEVAGPRTLFAEVLRLITELRPKLPPAPA